ncbi:MAG: hypothetical protein JRF27_00795 [Deltaproteobacteria bacterium]|nr:hypothetical protein [Deltaproteobacteria bacterium]MBW2192302.1 hypothetical protein [Deltaproteobacteria bacterium]
MSYFLNRVTEKEVLKRRVNAEPLWGAPAVWNEAILTMDHLIQLHRPELGPAEAVAQDVLKQLTSVFSLLEDLCSTTCPRCPDPCCLKAKVWFDFKDLLFLHLADQQLPLNPLMGSLRDTCRCLSHSGCTLPRIIRPWICTWYLCPPQVANLREKPGSMQAAFSRAVQSVKAGRKKMETEFIRVVS